MYANTCPTGSVAFSYLHHFVLCVLLDLQKLQNGTYLQYILLCLSTLYKCVHICPEITKKLFCHIHRKLKLSNQIYLYFKAEKSKIQRATCPKYQLSTAQSTLPPRSETVLLCSRRFLHPKEQLGQCLTFKPGFLTPIIVSMIIYFL